MGEPSGLVAKWERPQGPASGRRVHAMVVCFVHGELRDDIKLQVDRFGVSSVESFREVDTREHHRADDPEWFDNWRSGAARTIASRDLGGELSALDAADGCFTFVVDQPDPADLAHLQSLWALTRWFFARGASCAIDVHAMRFLRPGDVPAPAAELDIKREVSIIYETDATEPGGGHVLHTRGMRKVGRPDIIAVVAPAQVELVAEVMWQLASGMARGFMPGLPRHGVDLADDESWYLAADDADAFSGRLHLNNDARLLVTEDGETLVRALR
jgi:hypothetical protein